jgi:hypothetical protein
LKKSAIPAEWKALAQWVTWRLEKVAGRDKPTKVPYDPRTGRKASTTDRATWCDYETALRLCKANGYDGIGFVVTADDPYTVIDLDGCRCGRTGEIAPWALKIIRKLNTRTEISPSKKGVHLILRGKPPGSRCRKGPIEMYCCSRFITVTARVLDDTPEIIETRQAELEAFYYEVFGAEAQTPSTPTTITPTPSSLSDQELIKKAMASNSNFARLWEGDRNGYASESEADLALCSHLAFWTAKDAARMDQLFRQSGLMREKWERADYRDRTIAKAIEGTREVYQKQVLAGSVDGELTDFTAYYDAGRKSYWVTDSRGEWIDITETSLRRFLRAAGYSPHRSKGAYISPLETMLMEIQREFDVAFAGPLAGHSKGVLESCGNLILITNSSRLVEPKEGFWSHVKALLCGLLDDPHHAQLPYVLGWLKVAVEALRAGQVRPGQVLVIAGPRDSGKSLLQNLITEVLGGRAAKPFRYMSGATPFNGELFGAEHLLIEDEIPSTDIRSRRHLGARIKDFTVNEVQSHHAKHRQAISLKPFWRVSITLNDEPENMLILPPLDDSLADKIILLKGYRRPMVMPTQSLAQRKAFWEVLVGELPAFIHHLLSMEIPVELRSERFGVTHFHHPELVAALDDLSPELRLLSLIDTELFDSPAPSPWEGTADQLERRLREGHSGGEVSRLLTFNTACGVYLGRLHQKFPDRVDKHRDTARRTWTILPPRLYGHDDTK